MRQGRANGKNPLLNPKQQRFSLKRPLLLAQTDLRQRCANGNGSLAQLKTGVAVVR
jgi:hypothetical protein